MDSPKALQFLKAHLSKEHFLQMVSISTSAITQCTDPDTTKRAMTLARLHPVMTLALCIESIEAIMKLMRSIQLDLSPKL